jgi:hypothetical protein
MALTKLTILDAIKKDIGTEFTVVDGSPQQLILKIIGQDDYKALVFEDNKNVPITSETLKWVLVEKEKPITFVEICQYVINKVENENVDGTTIKFTTEHQYITDNGYKAEFDKYRDIESFIKKLMSIFELKEEIKILLEGEYYLQQ